MEQFYIDRQFGQPIFIDVENGIVKKCYNEAENYNARMNELYVGKSINFLNEDFIGRAMKGTYHHLRPMATYDIHQQIQSKKTHARNIWNEISSLTTPDERKPELRARVNQVTNEQYAYEANLKTEIVRIFNEHNFVV